MPPALPRRSAAEVSMGQGDFRYRAQPGWEQLPKGWSFVEVAGVAADSAGNVFVFNRGEHPVIVLDRQGQFLLAWGEGVFVRPHGISIGPDDAVYCVDDSDHTVRKFTPDGKLLFTIGTSGKYSDTGATTVDYRTIKRSGPPFNFPTNLAISPGGELYVADGYGNARVHRFTADGKWTASWGEPGAGPGQFRVPHGIAIDARGNVYVADRENRRIQIFSPTGAYIAQWPEVARPCQVTIDAHQNVFVAELGYRAGMFAGNEPPPGNPTGGRVSVFNLRGELQARWGGCGTSRSRICTSTACGSGCARVCSYFCNWC
jgi:DNA-binding beta-propeller fold protein YncE